MFNSTARRGLRKADLGTAASVLTRSPDMFAAVTWRSTKNVIKQATGEALVFLDTHMKNSLKGMSSLQSSVHASGTKPEGLEADNVFRRVNWGGKVAN